MLWYAIKRTVKLGAKSLWMHRLRSVLTALGIIFGVCSVIAMLAIGEGASRQAQERIARLGSTNIILETVKPPEDENPSSQGNSLKEYGLTYADAERIHLAMPNVEVVVPQRRLSNECWYRNRKVSIEVVGTVPWYLDVAPMRMMAGRFLGSLDLNYRGTVCVIDEAVYGQLFVFDDPIGARLKIGGDIYTVVGVVSNIDPLNTESTEEKDPVEGAMPVGRGGVAGNVYLPLTTTKQRFGEITFQFAGAGRRIERVELQQITVKVGSMDQVLPARDFLDDLLQRFHKQQDYRVTVPLELMRQARQTQREYSIVLGSIAAISLLVGGIGIMNIMLATVSERTREIGIRRALGAKQKDIIFQFLSETLLLTLTGGILGIILGALIPALVSQFGGMPTVITPISLILSFGISGAVGIIFGWYPAWMAANMDPIESLRHE